MMARFMSWRPRPPVLTKKFKVTLKVQSLEGLNSVKDGNGQDVTMMMMMIEVKWCGPKALPQCYQLGRSGQKTARTSEKGLEQGCIINWQQEFEHLCILTMATNQQTSHYLPFHIHFTIIQLETKAKTTVFGTASINLGQLAPSTQAEKMEHSVKLDVTSAEGQHEQVAILVVTVCFSEDQAPEKSLNLDCTRHSTLSCLGRALLCDQQIRGICEKKAKRMRKMVSFSARKTSGEPEYSVCSGVEEASDIDSVAGSEGQKVRDEENKHLHSYGSLTVVNLVVEGALASLTEVREDPSITPTKASRGAFIDKVSASESDQSIHMRQLLSWKRRRRISSLSERGEPLLRKAHSDTGGDDVDLVRQLSLTYTHDQGRDADCALLSSAAMSECLDCGELQFSVGCWEKRELVSRVGHMKLSTKVFFASIDQRSERAGGEKFDTLIRQGSAEWRTLCADEVYMKKFPDQHFDLDSVLEAKIRPLGIVEGGTSVGFFKPEIENSIFDFLHGAVLFDDIWEASIVEAEESQLLKAGETFEPAVYIVSWNDHFFLLKVDKEAYYIIDTLGERLFEGCKQAYMICFDKETKLTHQHRAEQEFEGTKKPQKATSSLQIDPKNGTDLPTSTNRPNESPGSAHQQQLHKTAQDDGLSSHLEENSEIEYTGRDACKEFIKGFFAALALKQLHKDIEKGLLGTSPLHKRLQIEFHRTRHKGMSSTVQHSSPPNVEEKSP
ncbi:hypothetical protein GOP47_0027734 [Adiantum capillus-veneris]|nr:hypothetical protein GOP47_0027734 [Adiantum capillus-veneris]